MGSIGNLLAHLIQYGTPEQQLEILKMSTCNAARAVGLNGDYGLAAGKQADFMILDAFSVGDAILDMPARSWVFKRGRIVARTCVTTTICKDCGHAEHGTLSAWN